jgi:glucosamine-6-phosphate deaminase
MDVFVKPQDELREELDLLASSDEDTRKPILIDRFIRKGKLHIDFVPIPYPVWLYAPLFVLPEDVRNVYFVKDLLFTCEDLGFKKSTEDIPREFRINYLVRRLIGKTGGRDAFLNDVAAGVPHGMLVRSYAAARANLLDKLTGALEEGIRRRWIFQDERGTLSVTRAGSDHLAWVKKLRSQVMARELGLREKGYEPLLRERLAESGIALAQKKKPAGMKGLFNKLMLGIFIAFGPAATTAWSAPPAEFIRSNITAAILSPSTLLGGAAILLVLWGGMKGLELIAVTALQWVEGFFQRTRYPDIGAEIVTVGTFGLIGAFFGMMAAGVLTHTLFSFCIIAAAGGGLCSAYVMMVYASKGAASSLYVLGCDTAEAFGNYAGRIRSAAAAGLEPFRNTVSLVARIIAGLREGAYAAAEKQLPPVYVLAGAPPVPGEPVWGEADIRSDGFIRQGTGAARAFASQISAVRKNDITNLFKERIIENLKYAYDHAGVPGDLKEKIRAEMNRVKQSRIYGFHSVVRGPDDFLLGWYNAGDGALYVAQDVIEALTARGPPALTDEYLLHEVLCAIVGHTSAIPVQQKLFPDHYPAEGLAVQTAEVPYKGFLGKMLRGIIDEQETAQKGLGQERVVPALLVSRDEDTLARAAAREIADQIQGNPATVLGLATGATPLKTYGELIRIVDEEGIDMSRVKTFNLDEYCGLAADDARSYHEYMYRHLFNHILHNPATRPKGMKKEHIHILNGKAPDPEAECRRFEDEIRKAGGIDLQILGIGDNGHIGFNEPGSDIRSRTREVALSWSTRVANARFFGDDPNKVPTRALSMGINTILGAKKILLIATTENKADAVAGAVEGMPTTDNPASSLQMHPNVSFLVTPAAAKKLVRADLIQAREERADTGIARETDIEQKEIYLPLDGGEILGEDAVRGASGYFPAL